MNPDDVISLVGDYQHTYAINLIDDNNWAVGGPVRINQVIDLPVGNAYYVAPMQIGQYGNARADDHRHNHAFWYGSRAGAGGAGGTGRYTLIFGEDGYWKEAPKPTTEEMYKAVME